MKKVKISIQEILRYERKAIIEIPNDMSEDELNNIFNIAQRRADSAEDITYIIDALDDDIRILEHPDGDLSSPWDSEIEIDEFDYIK
jgi:hypothetical protein